MERVYYIDHVSSDDINALSLKLNSMQEVSHIKINKDSISFNCARPDNIQNYLNESKMDYVLQEMVNRKKREYVSNQTKVEKIFMFTNLESEEEAQEIKNILSKYSVYENVQLDFHNKLLTLTTSAKALPRLSRIVENVNPSIQVEQWRKPFKSQDLFNEKYIQKYVRIALLCVGVALGLVTFGDTSFLTYVGWMLALLVCNEKVLIEAKRDLQLKNYLSENNIFFACLMGWIYGAFIETIVVSIMYQAGKQLIMQVTQWSMSKIDDLVAHQNLGRRLRRKKEEMIPLVDFDIGDVVVVNEGETVPLGGKIVKGSAKLDIYAIDGSDVCVKSKIGNEVYSGTVVTEGYLHVKTTALYEDSAMSKVVDIATNAPMSSSRTEKLIFKISDVYSKALIIVGLFCCIVLPLMNLTDNLKYMYLGIIMLTVSGSFAYVQGASFTLLAGVAKAFSKKIAIKENSGLDDLNTCVTIIYDRFDGIETTEEEMDLFEKIKGLHKSLIIFNDGPVDLENDEYTIYNNYTVEQKLEVMDKALVAGPVAYIGDCDKDIALLQKASVAISRGGVHNDKVQRNSDIMLTDSNFDTIIDLLKIARKQKSINIGNTFIGIVVSLIVVLLAVISFVPWWVACLVYILESVLILLNSQNIIRM